MQSQRSDGPGVGILAIAGRSWLVLLATAGLVLQVFRRVLGRKAEQRRLAKALSKRHCDCKPLERIFSAPGTEREKSGAPSN